MKSKQHVDIITFTMTSQVETLPSAILGNTHMYTLMCVPLYVYIIRTQRQTHRLHGHTNAISYKKRKI